MAIIDAIDETKADKTHNHDSVYDAKGHADSLNAAMNTRVEILESWHENFVACSKEDIDSLFT
jgi:hypothetical protein